MPRGQLYFSSSGGLVSPVGGSASARWALRSTVFSSFFRFFSPRSEHALTSLETQWHLSQITDEIEPSAVFVPME
jgi:hypothetical protein